ncbi:hypothetical protein BDV36DRAFT_302863 [Aspergillus pseudocaelatus]|uniref:Acetoacetate decarboxylase n=1 Tax=Aspergillus pseudocaelatus TaxID=1825620 RepID=A0ABQ6VZP4_9EURO|nr:hypothetical protein BDV36DRAFT_302863 [Aspergillus pseudocaelatus]
MESPTAAGCAKWDKVKGDIFMCIARSSITEEPAAASYHDLEKDSSFSKHIYAGGLQACIIVRYQKSPVGPYDELLWIPGAFRLPETRKTAYRATRIYVSDENAVYQGRSNWNVPKMLARFEFTESESNHLPYSKIKISTHKEGELFLELKLIPAFFNSRTILPINSKFFPFNLRFVFPPLPESRDKQEDKRVGTTEWKQVFLSVTGRVGVVKTSISQTSGNLFPDLGGKCYWLWLKGAEIRIEGFPYHMATPSAPHRQKH